MEAIFNFLSSISWLLWIIIILVLVAIRDIFFQKKHTISHNFPIIGHLRYLLEKLDQKFASTLLQIIERNFLLIVLNEVGFMLLPKKRTTMRVLVQIEIFMRISIFL